MERITKQHLTKCAQRMTRICGITFRIENGSSYTQWKLTNENESRVYLRANTKRELLNMMHAAIEGMYMMQKEGE